MGKAIIVSGLPASGKTTIARQIAAALSFELLDKDHFLEDLYEKHGVATWEDRKKLSRESDLLFQMAATQAKSPVLVSHWRATDGAENGGTPTGWLSRTYGQIIEVCCICDPEIATKRFLERQRHPGHFDQHRNPQELALKMKRMSATYPLNIGSLVGVDTGHPIDLPELIKQIRQHQQ